MKGFVFYAQALELLLRFLSKRSQRHSSLLRKLLSRVAGKTRHKHIIHLEQLRALCGRWGVWYGSSGVLKLGLAGLVGFHRVGKERRWSGTFRSPPENPQPLGVL